jgi:hypothetical protein
MVNKAFDDWLVKWLGRRSPAIVLRSPIGERFSTHEDWTPAERQRPAVHQLAQEGCARALERVGGILFTNSHNVVIIKPL